MINKVKKEKKSKAAKAGADLKEMLELLVIVKKNTRLTDKDKMIFTCKMTESMFDYLSACVKRIEKERE